MSKLLELLRLEHEPVVIYRSDKIPSGVIVQKGGKCGSCCLPTLFFSVIKNGKITAATKDSISCPGARTSLGFGGYNDINATALFLSCGMGDIPGQRKKKNPELAKAFLESFKAEEHNDALVFSPLSKALEANAPIEIVIFYASPNHLSALVTLAGYARETPDTPAIMPYSSGCQSIYQMPKLEGESENPRAILGMTDLTPRLFAERNKLTFAVPYKLYKTMEENAEESFLSASEWRNLLAAS